MDVMWYYWITVVSIVVNFYGYMCWPTLQPPLRPVTSKHELDSDESRKVLGSSVVTSVSIIMDHGNGTKTFLTDGIENPDIKTNVIGSPGDLLSPDRYEFYTFDETGDLVKRLMTWDEIQGLIAGSDGDSILGEASMPMYYSDVVPDKLSGTTHITANDFQTSDIQGVHKVVESVQNVLKSELAASQSKIPPVMKPEFLSHTPNWSLFLPSLLDTDDSSDSNNLSSMLPSHSTHYILPTTAKTVISSQPFSSSSSSSNSSSSSSSSTEQTISSAFNTSTSNILSITNLNSKENSTSIIKDHKKKPEKPIRYKNSTTKPYTSNKYPYGLPSKTTKPTSTTEKSVSSTLSVLTVPTTSTTKESSSTFTFGSLTTNDELFGSITNVLHQVSDGTKINKYPPPTSNLLNYSNSSLKTGSTTEKFPTLFQQKISINQNKNQITSSSLPNKKWTTPTVIFTNSVSTPKYSSVETKQEPNSSSMSNLMSNSSSAYQSKDIPKSTKIYETSTPIFTTGHIMQQKQPLSTSTKPFKPNKTTYMKIPSSNLSTKSVPNTTHPVYYQNNLTSVVTEKYTDTTSAMKLSTFSDILDSTTTRPEPLVTWISTYPLEENKKVSSGGLSDSDKLITEQYVSSDYSKHPNINEFFTKINTSSSLKESTNSTPTFTYTTFVPSNSNYLNDKNFYKPGTNTLKITSSTSSYNDKLLTRTKDTPLNINYSYLKITTEKLSTSKSNLTHFHELDVIESKTEPASYFNTNTLNVSNGAESSVSNIPSYTQQMPVSGDKYSIYTMSDDLASSETVMQRIPTINPPNKVFTNSSATTKHTAVTKPLYSFTEPAKNITQITIMLNKLNDTSSDKGISNKHSEYRNKASSKPNNLVTLNYFANTADNKLSTESTKPINALFVNDCITSLISSSLKDVNSSFTSDGNHKVQNENSHVHYYKLPMNDQKENSHIYYYKLPPITSQNASIYFYRPTDMIISEHKSEIPESTTSQLKFNTVEKQQTEKEYQKVTTVQHYQDKQTTNYHDDVIQDGISAVTNILLQTEGRVPNKEFTVTADSSNSTIQHRENSDSIFDASETVIHTTETATTKVLNSTTENVNSTEREPITTILPPIPVTDYKYEMSSIGNVENLTYSLIPVSSDKTTEFVDLASTTEISSTEQYANQNRSNITLVTTETSVTEVADELLATVLTTTMISSDFRNEYIIDDTNKTQDEEEDIKNYHPYNYTTINRNGNGFKNNSFNVSNVVESVNKAADNIKFKNITFNNINSLKNNLSSSSQSLLKNTTIPNIVIKNNTSNSTKNNISNATIKLDQNDKITPPKLPDTKNIESASNNRSTATNNTGKTEYIEVKLENRTMTIDDSSIKKENKTKINDNKTEKNVSVEANNTPPPPPSAFRGPANNAHRTQSSTINPNIELHPAPHESMGLEASVAYLGDDVRRFIDLCNELSFRIWTTQTGKSLVTSRSIVLSPFAALSTLAMIFLGARGSSSGIMNDFLRLDDMVTFNPHQVLQNITESVINTKNIGVANAAFVREIFSDKVKGKILDFYKERLQQYYDTHVEEIAFNSIGDLVRRRTNLLIKRQSQGRIQDYLKGSSLVLKPPLAVFTANIFQTDCGSASTEGRDGEMYFVVRPSTRQRRLVPIPAVVYRLGFLAGYEPGLDATAVTLSPESIVSTILILPGQQGQVAPGDGLARLEQRLLESSYRRGSWSRLLRSLLFRPGLELQIPRFSHKSVLNLTAGLQKMGMEEIFDSVKADLRGINGVSNELHLSDIVQINTFSTCGEETVGARHHIETYPSSPQRVGRASDIFDRSYLDDTASNYYSSLPLNLRPRQARLPDTPRLRFDRPFLYIVRHNPTGMILYIGRFNPRLLT